VKCSNTNMYKPKTFRNRKQDLRLYMSNTQNKKSRHPAKNLIDVFVALHIKQIVTHSIISPFVNNWCHL
jgi:hypothetical protein